MLNVADLPDDVDALKAMIAERDGVILRQDKELHGRDLLIEKLQHQLAGQLRHRFGASSESLDQLQLMLEDLELSRSAEVPKAEEDPEFKQKPVRKPLPDHLPRTKQILAPPEICSACGGDLKQVSEDVTEELDYIPGRLIVRQIVRPRVACRCCDRFYQAELPSRPIERGRPGAGLLAHVLVSKYADHLPPYRQSQIYAREGLDLDRSTLADWVGKSTALLEPLADAIGRHVRKGQAVFIDDTPVGLLAPGNGKTKTARMWVYARGERPWDSSDPPAAFYQFSSDRRGIHPQTHLQDYTGFIHGKEDKQTVQWTVCPTNGFAGFNALYEQPGVDEMAPAGAFYAYN